MIYYRTINDKKIEHQKQPVNTNCLQDNGHKCYGQQIRLMPQGKIVFITSDNDINTDSDHNKDSCLPINFWF